ncbi:DUF5134 domain-containing protein [Streptomyces sp. NPDC051582]|uniref:DUF5134 domain-containing protein n=1 Tax=Streptomyces sp. NPDC051582 TaxID=3155167 RepID=UPI003412020C
MSLPASLSAWLLVLLCAVSGGYCLLRARRSERAARGGAAGEALMGFGMAVMAVPSGIGPWGPGILLTVFSGAVLHALWLLRSGVHHAHHLVGSLAMAYMALTMADGHGHGGGPPLVTGALLLYFAGYVLLGGARLATAGGGGQPVVGGAPVMPAELTRACRLAMGMGMLAMLLSL